MTTLVTRVLSFLVLFGAAVTAASGQQPKSDVTELWIYRDARSPDNAKNAKGKTFLSYEIMPAARANDVGLTSDLPAATLVPNAKGTVCQLSYTLGAAQWASVRYTPDGETAGSVPGINVKGEPLLLDSATPIYLVFRARTGDNEKAVVNFKIGGVLGAHPDGTAKFRWNVVKTLRAELGGSWETYVIDLRGMHQQLEHVACPLTVTVKAEENADHVRLAKPIDVFLDDIRFTTVRPKN